MPRQFQLVAWTRVPRRLWWAMTYVWTLGMAHLMSHVSARSAARAKSSTVASRVMHITLSLPADLLARVDQVVREGRARSRNALVAAALERDLAAQQRAYPMSSLSTATKEK
jgi:hypothetical protein